MCSSTPWVPWDVFNTITISVHIMVQWTYEQVIFIIQGVIQVLKHHVFIVCTKIKIGIYLAMTMTLWVCHLECISLKLQSKSHGRSREHVSLTCSQSLTLSCEIGYQNVSVFTCARLDDNLNSLWAFVSVFDVRNWSMNCVTLATKCFCW